MSAFPEVPNKGHESLQGRETQLSPCSQWATDHRLPLLLSIHHHLTAPSHWHTNLKLSGHLPSHQHPAAKSHCFSHSDLDWDQDCYSCKIRWQALAWGFPSEECLAMQNDELRGDHQPWQVWPQKHVENGRSGNPSESDSERRSEISHVNSLQLAITSWQQSAIWQTEKEKVKEI